MTDGCNPPTTEVTYIEGDTTARGTSSTPPTPGGSRYLCKFAISCSILLQTSPLAKPHFLHLGPWCRPLFLSFRPMSLSSLSVAHQCPATCPLKARSRPTLSSVLCCDLIRVQLLSSVLFSVYHCSVHFSVGSTIRFLMLLVLSHSLGAVICLVQCPFSPPCTFSVLCFSSSLFPSSTFG